MRGKRRGVFRLTLPCLVGRRHWADHSILSASTLFACLLLFQDWSDLGTRRRGAIFVDKQLIGKRLNLHRTFFGCQKKLLSLGHHSLGLNLRFFNWLYGDLFPRMVLFHENCLSWPLSIHAHFFAHSHSSDWEMSNFSTFTRVCPLKQFLRGQTWLVSLFSRIDSFGYYLGIFAVNRLGEFHAQRCTLMIFKFQFAGSWVWRRASN